MTRQRRGYVIAAVAAAAATGLALLIVRAPGPAADTVATAGIVQGDVRVQRPGEERWQQLGRGSGPLVAGTRVRSTPNGRVALSLPGDISLRLDAGTEAVLADARTVDLGSGTIYVDSGTEAASEGVEITTPLGSVREIGTQFEVSAGEGGLRVRVRSGRVSVAGTDAPEAVTGSESEQLSLTGDGRVARGYFPAYGPEWAWMETLAVPPATVGQSLRSFLDWVARETGRTLRFDTSNAETRARTFNVQTSADGLAPMRALDVILSTTDFDYSLRGDGAIVIAARTR